MKKRFVSAEIRIINFDAHSIDTIEASADFDYFPALQNYRYSGNVVVYRSTGIIKETEYFYENGKVYTWTYGIGGILLKSEINQYINYDYSRVPHCAIYDN